MYRQQIVQRPSNGQIQSFVAAPPQRSGSGGMAQSSPTMGAAPTPSNAVEFRSVGATQVSVQQQIGTNQMGMHPKLGGFYSMQQQQVTSQNWQPTHSPSLGSQHQMHIVSPGIHAMNVPIVDESLEDDEDDSLNAARAFGQNDRLNKTAKREKIGRLNSTESVFQEDLVHNLEELEASEGRNVLEMIIDLQSELSDMVRKASESSRSRSLRFSMPDGSEKEGPRATIGILLENASSRCEVHGCVLGSPAYLCGKIQKGDVIMKVDDSPVDQTNIVQLIRGNDTPGSKVTLQLEREGKKRAVEVHLIRASAGLVQKKKQIYELVTGLAQFGITGDGEDQPAKELEIRIHESLKSIEKEYLENDIIIEERLFHKTDVLSKAQTLINKYINRGKEHLMSKNENQSKMNGENGAEDTTTQRWSLSEMSRLDESALSEKSNSKFEILGADDPHVLDNVNHSELKSEVDQLREQVKMMETLDSENRRLRSENEVLAKMHESALAEFSSNNPESSALQEKLIETKAQLDAMGQDVEKWRSEALSLREKVLKIGESSESVNILQSEIAHQRKEILQQTENAAQHSVKLSQTEEGLRKSEGEVLDLRNQIAELHQAQQQLEALKQSWQAKFESLSQTQKAAEEQISLDVENKDQIEALRLELKRKDDELEAQFDSLARAEQVRREMRDKDTILQKQSDALLAVNNQLQQARDESNSTRQRLDDAQAELREMKSKMSSLDRESLSSQEDLKLSRDKILALEMDKSMLSQELGGINVYKAERDTLKIQLEGMKDKYDALMLSFTAIKPGGSSAEVDSLRAQLRESQALIDHLKRDLNETRLTQHSESRVNPVIVRGAKQAKTMADATPGPATTRETADLVQLSNEFRRLHDDRVTQENSYPSVYSNPSGMQMKLVPTGKSLDAASAARTIERVAVRSDGLDHASLSSLGHTGVRPPMSKQYVAFVRPGQQSTDQALRTSPPVTYQATPQVIRKERVYM